MAVTENTMTGAGDGSTNSFSFTFPYLKTTDLKVELVRTTTADSTTTKTILDSTKFTIPTATSVALSSFTDTDTDGNGVLRNTWQAYDTGIIKADGGGYTYSGKVYRSTASDALTATFYPGSAIRSADLNDNYTQNLYVTQEASNLVTDANTDAATALTKATTAETNATAALDNSQDLSADPSSAIAIAQAAQTAATNAENTANSAAADVADAVLFTTVADKAALEALTPSEDAYYQTTDSTGLANGTWTTDGDTYTLSGIPGTYPNTQLDGITTKFNYTQSTKTYAYTSYFANDGDDRYMVGPDGDGSSGQYLQTDGAGVKTWATVDLSTKQPIADDLTALSSCQTGGAAALALLTSTEVEALDGFTGDKDDLIYAKDLRATGVTDTEFDYLDGVTSAIQTQLDAKPDLADDQTWTGAQRGDLGTLSSSSNSTAVDLSVANNFNLTLGENSTLAQPSNQVAGQSGSIFITQDTGGGFTLSYHDDWKWAGGSTPTLTTTAAAVDRIDYIVAAANTIHAVVTLDSKTGT